MSVNAAYHHVLSACAALMAVALVIGSAAAEEKSAPTFKIQCRKANDSVTVVPEKERMLLKVNSEMGIGTATIELKSGEWPATVTFQFRYPDHGFKYLSSFELSNGRMKLSGSVDEADKMPLRLADAEGKFDYKAEPAGHLTFHAEKKDTGIEVTLPANLLIGSKQIQLQWIDLYR
jgi:hypothetical protein